MEFIYLLIWPMASLTSRFDESGFDNIESLLSLALLACEAAATEAILVAVDVRRALSR